MRRAAVMTHRRVSETQSAIATLREAAVAAGFELDFDPEEIQKHGDSLLPAEREGSVGDDVEICFALGGDGTVLRALRRFAETSVPVFAVNFGEIGFLATIERTEVSEGFARAFRSEFEVLKLPALRPQGAHLKLEGAMRPLAVNDLAVQRHPGFRVANLAYGVSGEEVGSVRCDGLVATTPAGSTGYNLANGGPVMAWGVHGYAISFIAPHSLSARSVVFAPNDSLTIKNLSSEESVDVALDGRPAGAIEPGGQLSLEFVSDQTHLAQLSGSTFYHRLREKFSRLSA